MGNNNNGAAISQHDLLWQFWPPTPLRQGGIDDPYVIPAVIVQHRQFPELPQPRKGWDAQVVRKPPVNMTSHAASNNHAASRTDPGEMDVPAPTTCRVGKATTTGCRQNEDTKAMLTSLKRIHTSIPDRQRKTSKQNMHAH